MAIPRRVLPKAEANFLSEAAESGLFTKEEINIITDDLSTQFISVESLTEQERLLGMTNDLIDKHADMLVHYPKSFTFLTRRQAVMTKHLEQQRDRLTNRMAGRESETIEINKSSNKANSTVSVASSGGDIPAFRSLNTPRMGGGLT